MMAQMVPSNFWEALDQLRGNPPKALLEAKEKAEKEQAAQAGTHNGTA
jgi:hypothetical protein